MDLASCVWGLLRTGAVVAVVASLASPRTAPVTAQLVWLIRGVRVRRDIEVHHAGFLGCAGCSGVGSREVSRFHQEFDVSDPSSFLWVVRE